MKVAARLILAVLVLLAARPALAQQPVSVTDAKTQAVTPTHQIVSSWADNAGNPAGDVFNLYLLAAQCPPAPAAGQNPSGFAKVGSLIAAKTFTNTAVTTGNYCTAVTASNADGSGESLYSNLAPATVPAFAPTALTATPGSAGSVVLLLTDALNGTGTTWNFYVAPGGTNGCSGSLSLTKIASGLAAKTFTYSPGPGSWCFGATATLNSIESAMSPLASMAAALLAPSGLVNAAQ